LSARVALINSKPPVRTLQLGEDSMRSQLLAPLLSLLIAAPAQAALTDDEPANDDISTASDQVFKLGPDTAEVGSLTLEAGDLDLIGVPSLIPGDVLTVSTTPLDDPNFEVPDTIVGIFDDTGIVCSPEPQNQWSCICVSDDAFNNDLDLEQGNQFGYGSLCRVLIDTAGDYFVGVTGFSEPPFDGTHSESGNYVLTVTLSTALPEPALLAQLGSGIAGLALLDRLRRRGQKKG
jgi:hypothetical protein